MKKILSLCILFGWFALSITSCKKDDNTGGGTTILSDSLYISLSTSTVEFNGFDYSQITVKDKSGVDITSSSTLYASGTIIGSNKFVPTGTGTYLITASKGSTPTTSKTITAIAATPSPFTQKLLIEDCTGAWCGFCTRIYNSVDNYKASQPKCISMAIHGGSSGTDPFKFQHYTSFNSTYSVTGYPTVIINRKSKWDENTSTLNSELTKWAPLGLAIESSTTGTVISGKVKVKFNVNTDKTMRIVVALVENGLLANQSNYYSPTGGYTPHLYGGANPITNFVHNYVLRRTSTDLFGDIIPTASQVKNGIYELNFNMSTSGNTSSGTYTAIPANCGIVAFVVDGTSTNKGVYNVQYASVGSIKNFD